MAEAKNSVAGAIVGLLIAGGVLWYYFGGGLDQEAAREMGNIENKVASDSVTEYGIAKRNGSAMDICVQAGLVSAAYLQAKDEANYQKWKRTETDDCKAAGISK